jgi:hypothetical protein
MPVKLLSFENKIKSYFSLKIAFLLAMLKK